MAITFTGTDITNISRLLKLTATAGEGSVVIATRNQTTGLISSSYLSASQIAFLTTRMNDVAALVTAADFNLLNYMMQSFIMFTDLTGVSAPIASVAAGVESVSLTGLIDNQPVYVLATLPHSIIGPFVWAPM